MTPWTAVAETERPRSGSNARPDPGNAAPVTPAPNNPAASAKLAVVKWFISLKDSRPIPELRGSTGEAGWDMLLDLYLGELLGRKTSVTSACIASRVPPTTALRHVNALCDAGWVERDRDKNDARRCWLKLTPHMRGAIDRYLEKAVGNVLDVLKADL